MSGARAPSPEEVLTQAQQKASDDLAVCAIEHSARLGRAPNSQEDKAYLIAQAATLLAYAYVDFVERYGDVEPSKLRGVVLEGVGRFAPQLSKGGEG